jgi:signal transduction histidine kinase
MSTKIFGKENPKILFWDDEAMNDKELLFTEIQQGLESQGWKVQVVTEKEQAKTIALSGNIDALVLDLKEGEELVGLEILKIAREKSPFLPIVMFTLYSEMEYIKGAYKEDASYYLTVPIRSYYDVIRAIEVAVEREKAKERLIQDQYFASIGKLAAGVSHYIKNALWAISSRSQYLMESPGIQTDEEAKKHLDIINKKCGEANKVVANLLNFAKREPQEDDNIEHVDIVEVVDDILDLVSFECENHKIEEKRYLPDKVVKIIGNEFEMKEAFLNIVKNAIEAMEDGGELMVDIKLEDDYIIVEVTDTGVGMNEEVLQNLFLPFYTTKDSSAGFGLFDTRRIVHNHKGKIEVESQPGKGTTVTVTFPHKAQSIETG